MLFDLKGKRRRLVQATYLTLAVLMGGGLVFFGIGGDVSGGLFDAFSDRGGRGGSLVEDRIEDNQERVAENPNDQEALQELVRDWFALARDEADPNTGQFTEEGRERLTNAHEAWQRYLELEEDDPDATLATLMVQVYDPLALNNAEEGARAAEIVTEENPSAQAYLNLVRFAALAGQERKADLAGQRAIRLAPREERSTVRALVEQARQPIPQAGGGPDE